MSSQFLSEWPLIPTQAFLYFPTGAQIKEGKQQKEWRKIFQDGVPYDEFQNRKLAELQQQLTLKKIQPNSWFSNANKLRFLQANKFKVGDTCKSIKQASNWRKTSFPLKSSPQINTWLNEGAMYFCGRDQAFRPILIIEIKKLKSYNQDTFPIILNNLLQFAVDKLLIQGQVQNYVLIINLNDTGVTDLGSVSKIVGFTNNTYRSRLYASYLLNASIGISASWNGVISGLVSENTAKKIKVSRENTHNDMWKHIDKNIVQKKYGGTLGDLTEAYWPPSEKLMNYVSANKGKLLTKQQYNQAYRNGKLANRKIKQSLIQAPPPPPPVPEVIPKRQSQTVIDGTRIDSSRSIAQTNPLSILPRDKVRKEILPPIYKRDFKLFFEDPKFQAIFKV